MTPRSKWIRIAVVIAGGALFAALLHRVGWQVVKANLLAVRSNVWWLAVPYVVGTVIGAAPWGLLLPSPCRPRWVGIVLSRFAASGANAFSFGVGGEPFRLLWVRPEHRRLGFAAVVVDRMIYNTANAVLVMTGVVAVTFIVNAPRSLAVLGTATALGMCVLTYLGGMAILSPAVGGRLHSMFVRRASVRAISSEAGESAAKQLLGGRAQVIPLAAVVHFVGKAILASEVYFAFRALGVHVAPAAAVVLIAGQVALSAVTSWVPGQIGTQEGGQALLCAALGIDPALGVAAALLQRIRQVASVLPSPLLIASASPEAAPGDRAVSTQVP